MRLKIGTKIGIVFIILLMLMVLHAILDYITARQYEYYIHEIEEEIEEIDLIKRLQFTLAQVVMPANDFLILGGDPNEPKNLKTLSAKVENIIKKLAKLEFDRPEEREIFNHIKKEYQQVKDIALKIFSIPNPVGNPKAGQLMEEMDKIANDAVMDVEEFHQFAHQEIEEALTSWKKTESLLNAVHYFTISFSFLLIIGSLVFFIRTISLPINSMKNTAVEFSQGNFDKRVEVTTKDEIGYLANAFNSMGTELKSSYKELKKEITERKKLGEELKKKMHKLERFHGVVVGRELKMKELKNRIKELEEQLKERKYKLNG